MNAHATLISTDRLLVAIVLAIVLHLMAFFGVRFRFPHPADSHVMEVTLALHRNQQENRDADFLAQANQKGSGQLKEAAVIESPEQSPFHDAVIQATTQMQQKQIQQKDMESVITTAAHSWSAPDQLMRQKTQEVSGFKDMNADEASQKIATLEARLSEQRQAYAHLPRISTVSSLSTRADIDATYIDAFRKKIELVGNEFYPAQARILHLQGSVRLMVTIDRNGRVLQIDVLKRSGSAILDAAAERSVWQAQPFQPFTPQMLKKADILRVIRTWKYADDHGLSSHE